MRVRGVFALCGLLCSVPAMAGTTSYEYDARGRLVRVYQVDSVNPGVDTTYSYDNADNRTAVVTSGAQSSASGFRVIIFGPSRGLVVAVGD